MRFQDSDTQKLLRETTSAFLADKFPHARLYAIEKGENPLTADEVRGFAELGWLGLTVPEDKGGAGPPLLDAAVVIDEFGYAAVPAPIVVTIVASQLLASVEAAPEHLSQLTEGTAIYTVSAATRRRGPIRYGTLAGAAALSMNNGTLTGTLPLVPFAGIATFVLAPLTVDGEPAFGLIPLVGARIEPVRVLDRASTAHVHFDGASANGAILLATGPAAVEMHELCDALMTGFSVVETGGLMRRVLEMSTTYISNRVQFGQPVAKFQAARHRAAELLMQSESARWAAYHAIWRLEEDPSDRREIWLAKHWSNRAGPRMFELAHLLHGGVGVGLDYPLHLYTQWLESAAVQAGTQNEMTNRIVEEAVPSAGKLATAAR